MACCHSVLMRTSNFAFSDIKTPKSLMQAFAFFSPEWIVVYCLFFSFSISHVFKLSTIEVHVVLLCPALHVLELLLKDVCTKISFDHLPESGVVCK